MNSDHQQIETDLKRILADSYPDINIRVETWSEDRNRIAVYFTEEKFVHLYPMQRYHYLVHLIPDDYFATNLENAVWFELAPGESPEDLRYPDDELIGQITPDVMKCVAASGFFRKLDDALCPESPDARRAPCWGDYRHSKPILLQRGFSEAELFDVFHVFMSLGGYCDCEILYNVAETSRLKTEYWTARAEGREPFDPHGRG